MRRHWLITDANGKVQEVRGDGVVGGCGQIQILLMQCVGRASKDGCEYEPQRGGDRQSYE